MGLVPHHVDAVTANIVLINDDPLISPQCKINIVLLSISELPTFSIETELY